MGERPPWLETGGQEGSRGLAVFLSISEQEGTEDGCGGLGGQCDLSWLRLSCACACVRYWVLGHWAGLGMEVLNPMTERAFHGLGGNFTGVGVSCLSDNQMIPKGHASSYISGFRFRSPPSHPVIPRSPADRRIS